MFFFSSRRRHTRSDRDWSSDVCSSDLEGVIPGHRGARETPTRYGSAPTRATAQIAPKDAAPRGIEARAGTFHAPRRAVGAQARVFSVRDGADAHERASDGVIFALWTAVNTWISAERSRGPKLSQLLSKTRAWRAATLSGKSRTSRSHVRLARAPSPRLR